MSEMFDKINETTKRYLNEWEAKKLTSMTMIEAIARIDNEPDGTRYEDEFNILEKKDGIITMTGKPFRSPLIYTTT